MWFKLLKRRHPFAVLMVCAGNICRSPMAEAVLRAKLAGAGLANRVAVDSAGTHGFHRGAPADPRAVARAGLRGYRLAGQTSRPLAAADFSRYDLLLAMDRHNLATMISRCPPGEQHRLGMLLPPATQAAGVVTDDAAGRLGEVPDPYYGSVADFDLALDLIEPACDSLLSTLRRRLAELR